MRTAPPPDADGVSLDREEVVLPRRVLDECSAGVAILAAWQADLLPRAPRSHTAGLVRHLVDQRAVATTLARWGDRYRAAQYHAAYRRDGTPRTYGRYGGPATPVGPALSWAALRGWVRQALGLVAWPMAEDERYAVYAGQLARFGHVVVRDWSALLAGAPLAVARHLYATWDPWEDDAPTGHAPGAWCALIGVPGVVGHAEDVLPPCPTGAAALHDRVRRAAHAEWAHVVAALPRGIRCRRATLAPMLASDLPWVRDAAIGLAGRVTLDD